MEQQQAATPRPDPTSADRFDGLVDVEQAEAALVEHYPRLVRLAYLILPPGASRSRRVLAAHAVVQRSLPRRPTPTPAHSPALPAPCGDPDPAAAPGYACVRLRVLRTALGTGRRRWLPVPPPPLPRVWGLRLSPRSGGADELALEQALSALSAPGRAAFALCGPERLTEADALRVLAAAGVADTREALAEAARVATPAGSRDRSPVESAEFDPCALQARPTDLIRRRQHVRAVLAGGAAVLVCGGLLGLPGGGWGPAGADGPGGAAAPPYARNAAAQAALDPAKVTAAAATAWRSAARQDFAAWPARGDRVRDRELLRRALAVWARPGSGVRVAATPGTAAGPAAGPPQLLFAGVVDHAVVVLFHDGLRVVRYAEAADGADGSGGPGTTLDFARTDGAAGTSADAVVAGRTHGNVRYLTAPWVTSARLVDLLKPDAAGRVVHRDANGLTGPVPTSAPGATCTAWPALRTGGELLTDLAEPVPARLTYGAPREPGAVSGARARTVWARTACQLAALRGQGVSAVNSWEFARQPLPGGAGSATWVCTRAETWRGAGSLTFAQIQTPAAGGRSGAAPGAAVARADGGTACGPRAPRVLAGVLWKATGGHPGGHPDGRWWLLAAGSEQVTSITATGGVRGQAAGRFLAVPAKAGDRAELTARLADGERLTTLR
ncbi:hypothetical protein ACH4GP_25635 [Streptomyces celluloflavus]|uniref:DNA-directed RNA polymerase specialized sigma24 family protein n=1 Tax=Streptomyces celluloflavus TaxID=58344 RepID=A0ABW7RN72_9ACTN